MSTKMVVRNQFWDAGELIQSYRDEVSGLRSEIESLQALVDQLGRSLVDIAETIRDRHPDLFEGDEDE